MPPRPLTDDPTALLATLAVLATGDAPKSAQAEDLAGLLGRPTIRHETLEKLVTALIARGIANRTVALKDVRSLNVEHRLCTLRCPPANRARLTQLLLEEPAVATVWECEGRDDLVVELVAEDPNAVEHLVQRYRPESSLRVVARVDSLDAALREIVRRRLP